MQVIASAIALTVLVSSILPKVLTRAGWLEYRSWAASLPGLGRLNVAAATLMLAAEIALVGWLLAEYDHPRLSLYGFALLLTGYALYTLYQLSRGRRDLQCLCFGATPNPLDAGHAITNLSIALLTLVLGHFGRHVAGAEVPGLALIGVLLGASATNLPVLIDLLRPAPAPHSTVAAAPSSAPRPH